MPIIFRYLFSTCFRYTIGMFFGFALLQIGQQVISILEKLPNIALEQLAYLILLLLPDAVNDIAPVALVLAVLITGNQLYSQSEIYILRSAGLNPLQVSFPLLFTGLVIGILMTINASYLKPAASLKLSELVFEITNSNFTEYLVPGEFRELKNLGLTVTAEDNKAGKLGNVFMHKEKENQIITGEHAYIINRDPFSYSLEIESGSLVQLADDSLSFSDFDTYSVHLTRSEFKPRDSVEFYNNSELHNRGGNFPTAELHWRLSRFLFCTSLTAIALLFIPKSPRSGTSLAIMGGIIMFFAFNQIANDFYSDAAKGRINPALVFWCLYPLMYVSILVIKILSNYGLRRIQRAI